MCRCHIMKLCASSDGNLTVAHAVTTPFIYNTTIIHHIFDLRKVLSQFLGIFCKFMSQKCNIHNNPNIFQLLFYIQAPKFVE